MSVFLTRSSYSERHGCGLNDREHAAGWHDACKREAGGGQQGTPLCGIALARPKHQHHVEVAGGASSVVGIRRGLPRRFDDRLHSKGDMISAPC